MHSSDYFYTPVQWLTCAGAISGYGDGTFRPYADTTRGQLAKIIVGAEGFSANGSLPGLLAFVFDLAWMIWLVVMAWQRPQAVRPLATAPAAAS